MAGHPMQSYFYIPSFFRPNTLIKCILHTYRGQNTVKTLKCRFFKKWLWNVTCRSLRVWEELVASLGFWYGCCPHTQRPGKNATKCLKKWAAFSKNRRARGGSTSVVGNKSILLWDRGHWRGVIYTHPNMAGSLFENPPSFVMAAEPVHRLKYEKGRYYVLGVITIGN